MTNVKSGSKLEILVAGLLQKENFWVHIIEKGKDGSQPADIIVVGDCDAGLIDCKVLSNKTGKFPLSRVEENQHLAYKKWVACGNSERSFGFAIQWNNAIYMVLYSQMDFAQKTFDLAIFDKQKRWILDENNSWKKYTDK